MKNHNHSFLRFLFDTILVLILLLIILSPIFMVFSLKIENYNLQASIIEAVAGAKTKK